MKNVALNLNRRALRSPAPEDLVVRYSCPHCGADVDYDDGFQCVPCGVVWGDSPGEGDLNEEWENMGARLFPAATPLDPVHLLFVNQTRESWVLHVGGCPTRKWDRASARCRFSRRVGSAARFLYEGKWVIAGEEQRNPLRDRVGVDDFGGERPERVDASLLHRSWDGLKDNGLYLVDAGGPDDRPLRIVSLLAEAGKDGLVAESPWNIEVTYPQGSRHAIVRRRHEAEKDARNAAWEAARKNRPVMMGGRRPVVEGPAL